MQQLNKEAGITPRPGQVLVQHNSPDTIPLSGPMFPPGWGAKDQPILNLQGSGGTYSMQDLTRGSVSYTSGRLREKNVNPAVYDTLVKVTGQKLGDNVVAWQRWWAIEKKNRDLQKHPDSFKPKTGDRVISKPSPPGDEPASR